MIPISDAFRAELQKQIRNKGRVEVRLISFDGLHVYTIPEYLVQSVEMHGKADPLCRSLPIEECTITILDFENNWNPVNPSGYNSIGASGLTVYVRFGIETGNGTEWTEYIKYIADKDVSWANNTATFHAVRELQTFNSQFSEGLTNSNNLSDQASECLFSGYPAAWGPPQIDFEISPKMAQTTIIGHTDLTGKTKKDALLSMCFAGRCTIRTKYYGTIEIRDFWLDEPEYNLSVISKLDTMSLPTIDVLPLAGFERVNYLVDPETAERRTVLNVSGDYDVEDGVDEPVFIAFDSSIVPYSFTATALTNIDSGATRYVATRSGLYIYELARLDGSQPWTITATGIVQSPVNAQLYERIFGLSEESGSQVEEIKNPLLNADNAYSVAVYRGLYLRRTRSLYKFNYRGNPSIEPLDTLRVELPNYGTQLCIVVEHTFRFSAGFSGSISVRKIDPRNANQHSGVSGAVGYAMADFAEVGRE